MKYVYAKNKYVSIKGYMDEGIATFKGITYGKAKRFHSPRLVMYNGEEVEALNYGYVCPLLNIPKPNGELLVEHRYWPMNEDCLNLNIWTPSCQDQDKKRPVLVWFHGGAFSDGSSIEQVCYDGAAFSREADTVVVSVNHRLNILGFFDLSNFGPKYKNSANAGIEDLVVALKWIRLNIEAFGGDPDNVTIMGQSGGGSKVNCMLQCPDADGLFAKAVNMSGVVPSLFASPSGKADNIAFDMLEVLGLTHISELETISYHRLFEAYLTVKWDYEARGEYVGCMPKANYYFAGAPLQVGFRKESQHIPMVIGSVFAEFSAFGPIPLDRASSTEAEVQGALEKMVSPDQAEALIKEFAVAYPDRPLCDVLMVDGFFRGQGISFIEERSKLNACTYSYVFDMDFPIDEGRPAWHCADLPFVFKNNRLVTLLKDEAELYKVEAMEFGWLKAFVHTGNPNTEALPEWPACQPGQENVMIINQSPQLKTNYDHAFLNLHRVTIEPIFEANLAANKVKFQH